MKRYFIIPLLFVALMATSCKDMLKEEPYAEQTTENFLADESNAVLIVGQAYADLKWLHDHWCYWGLCTLSSDECINPVRNPGSDWNDDGYWKGFLDHSWTPNDMSFEFLWSYSNSGAVLCNKIISQLSKYEGMDAFIAEMKVLRCYYYYTLFDCFGRIPYLEDYSSAAVPQSEPWVVWNKLITTLETEGPKMGVVTDENRASYYGRCTQGMAYTLLARLYLNAESYGITPENCGIDSIKTTTDFYKNCIRCCEKVRNDGSYIIEDDFFANFKIKNEGSKENIFVIVEDPRPNFDYQDAAGKCCNKLRVTMLTLNYCHQICWNTVDKPWNGFCAPQDFLAKYKVGGQYGIDLRGPCDSTLGTHGCDGWGWFLGPVYLNDMSDSILQMDDKGKLKAIIRENVTSLTDAKHDEGARFLKYEVAKDGLYKYCDNDFVLFRYADVLYMNYEAALRAGDDAKCAELLSDPEFQKIRTRVGCTAYGSLDLEELLDERGREFAWEMVRRRDLIRYGRFAEGTWLYKPAREKYFNWFPIPRKVIETSGGLWTQNEGYTTDN